MHATELPKAVHRDGWVYEEKYDGWRMVAEKVGSQVTLTSRNGLDHTHRFPELVRAIAELDAPSFVVDGEIAIFDQQLISRFEWLRPPSRPSRPRTKSRPRPPSGSFRVSSRILRMMRTLTPRSWSDSPTLLYVGARLVTPQPPKQPLSRLPGRSRNAEARLIHLGRNLVCGCAQAALLIWLRELARAWSGQSRLFPCRVSLRLADWPFQGSGSKGAGLR